MQTKLIQEIACFGFGRRKDERYKKIGSFIHQLGLTDLKDTELFEQIFVDY